jgi:hypothetical protein
MRIHTSAASGGGASGSSSIVSAPERADTEVTVGGHPESGDQSG